MPLFTWSRSRPKTVRLRNTGRRRSLCTALKKLFVNLIIWSFNSKFVSLFLFRKMVVAMPSNCLWPAPSAQPLSSTFLAGASVSSPLYNIKLGNFIPNSKSLFYGFFQNNFFKIRNILHMLCGRFLNIHKKCLTVYKRQGIIRSDSNYRPFTSNQTAELSPHNPDYLCSKHN